MASANSLRDRIAARSYEKVKVSINSTSPFPQQSKQSNAGQLWVVGVGEDGVMAFTDDGIENLKNLIQIHKGAPWIIEERRQLLAAIVKPKAEKPDEV